MMRLHARDRRALFIAAPLITLSLLLNHGLPGWRAWIAAKQDSAWNAQTKAARAGAVLGQRAEIEQSLHVAGGRFLAVRGLVLSGRSAVTAGASLLRTVSNSVNQAGLMIGSLQATQDTLVGRHFVRVSVRGEATGDIIGVLEFLEAVESERAQLCFRELSIDQPDPSLGNDHAETLRIRFLVTGLARRQEDLR